MECFHQIFKKVVNLKLMALKFQNLSKQIMWVPLRAPDGPAKTSLRGKRQQRALLLLKMMSMVSMKMMSRGALARHPFWTAASCKGDLWPAPLPRYMVDHLQTPQWSRKAFHQPWTVPLIFFFQISVRSYFVPHPIPQILHASALSIPEIALVVRSMAW